MDFKELVKLQFVSQIGHSSNNGATNKNMIYQVFLMALMSFLEDIMKAIPKLFEQGKASVPSYFTKRVKETIDQPKLLNDTSVTLNTKHTVSSFVMFRIYIQEAASKSNSEGLQESNQIADAVIAQISKLTNVPSFKLIEHGQIMVTYKDKPIQMTKDIYFKIDNITLTPAENVSSIKFTLLSNTLTASELATYVRTLYKNYLEELKNALGNNIYFFDQKQKDSTAPQLPVGTDSAALKNHKRMIVSTAPKQLSFTMSPFYSNKQFQNIYGEQARAVENRIKFFIENKDWYDTKGIPYQLGILLSGLPGSGKTSIVKAIANYTKRHIINVNFANITTASQLKNLFYSDKIQVYTDNTMSNVNNYFIPIDQRIYVLEEIDAIGDIVKQRTADNKSADAVPDELTLAEILTILDGTMEIPGRIVIITTNHPEVLDSALIRPGRIDIHASFGNSSRQLIKDMYEGYLERKFPEELIEQLPDGKLSPAEVGQVLFRHFGVGSETEVDVIVADLIATSNKNAPAPSPKDSQKDSQKDSPKDSPKDLSRDETLELLKTFGPDVEKRLQEFKNNLKIMSKEDLNEHIKILNNDIQEVEREFINTKDPMIYETIQDMKSHLDEAFIVKNSNSVAEYEMKKNKAAVEDAMNQLKEKALSDAKYQQDIEKNKIAAEVKVLSDFKYDSTTIQDIKSELEEETKKSQHIALYEKKDPPYHTKDYYEKYSQGSILLNRKEDGLLAANTLYAPDALEDFYNIPALA